MADGSTSNKNNENEKKIRRGSVPPKKQLTEDELKMIVNTEYAKSNEVYKVIKEAVDNITQKVSKPIIDLIDFADKSLEFVITENEFTGRKEYTLNFNLTDTDLEFLAIKIPVVCIYIQEQVNSRALDAAIAEYLFEDAVTEHLKGIVGGDAKERLRFAEQQAEVERIVSIIKKQVYINLKAYIDRADKIYEGIKKVLDGRNNEKKLFGKANKFSA